ncbi:hypothetical protein E4420_11860 [Stenotrophomonas maltophilia]|nr:hypothetical protein [Stenotrophomonas maltophilia]MBA0296204.1 hypothetical protein [Stenotrophomonas maltophilia]MBA0350328.1 hypothetical protein [Stenotrophomonas maltophilia]MBA0417898.1 hypothetical protein [Stenotrophomonas maltophilia]PJL52818.1 hypothetical protein B9Y73_10205 [Stenotrophomonas maltophilia]
MSKDEKTSGRVASQASQILRNSSSSKADKSMAGSALAQAGTNKTTSSKIGTIAARALERPTTSKAAKAIAGSVLTQKSKK